MRTDLKVGLICAFVLLLAVVAYFAFPGTPKTEPVANTPSKGLTSGTSGKEPAGGTVAVAPPASSGPSESVASGSGSAGGTGVSPMLAAGEPGGATTGPAGGGLMIGNPGGAGLPSAGSGGGLSVAPSTGPSAGGGMGAGSLGAPGSLGTFGGAGPAGNTTTGGETGPLAAGGSRTGDVTAGAGMSTRGGTGRNGGTGRSGRRGGLVESPPGPVGVPFMPPAGGTETPGASSATGGTAGGGSTYTVVRGDVLTAIARKNHVTLAAIEAANPGMNPNVLKVGAKIHVPASTASATGARSERTAGGTGRSGTTGRSGSTTRPAAAGRTAGGAAKAGSTYVVKKGDTLRKIAKAAYGDEGVWRRIARVNRGSLKNPNALTAGQVLRLPAK
ncbi:MAG TPA: LysM peptidoglycan-binding domain-containing protein [Phycisphaerae bacterium]|nr:LysM peptidoglycan-binding domain-containing protein [Phycisphaerae bacterium]